MGPSQHPRYCRVVVAGGAGFLGSHLCDALLRAGSEVICLDNLSTGSASNVEHLVGSERFRFLECDVTDAVELPGTVDLVLNFASPASPVDYLRLPIQTLKAGSAGTMNLLNLARDKEARFVLASTSEVYGSPQQHPQREDYWGHVNSVGPRAVYDEAKRFAEALTTAFRTTHGVNTAIVRIFNTYGPRMRPHDGRAIPTFIRQALAGHPLTIAGDGQQTRSVCYVSDLIRGVVALAESDHPGPINIGSPIERSILSIALDIVTATQSMSAIDLVERPADDPQVRRPDITLAGSVLDWRPRVEWPEGLLLTIGWYAKSLGLPADVIGAVEGAAG